jgi:predicted transcriptional regulator
VKPKGKHKVNHEYCSAFGNHLRKLIAEKGYSLRGFVAHADIEYGTLSRIVRGESNCTISTSIFLADALGVGHHEMFNFKFPSKNKKLSQ